MQTNSWRTGVAMTIPAIGFLATAIVLLSPWSLPADTFTYVDRKGNRVRVEARLAGSGQKFHALELADGEFRLIPEAAVLERKPGKDPEPIDNAAMEKKLIGKFPENRVVTWIDDPLVLAMVLARPIENQRERARRLVVLKQAGRFFGAVQVKFLDFIRTTHVPRSPLRFPLVALIFESDDDFDAYASSIVGEGTPAEDIAGFYSSMSNYLVLRYSECDTFQVPMHEFIHMQVHNRGIFERFAPIPVWFHEGLATSFEGNRGRIIRTPANITQRYARLALKTRNVTGKEIISRDRTFGGNILTGEAYGNAWAMHWLLLTQYKAKYSKYVRHLATKKALEPYSAEDRLKDFEEIIGKSPNELQREFLERLAQPRRRSSLDPLLRPTVRFPAVASPARIPLDFEPRAIFAAPREVIRSYPFRSIQHTP